MPLFKKSKDAPSDAFDEGWQFYSKATTLEPPGTVFRIDANGRRYIVGKVDVASEKGEETVASLEKRVSTTLGMFIRFLGLDKLGIGGKLDRVQQFAFELKDSEREITTDLALDDALLAFLEKLDYRADNRYFVIREALSATSMLYALTKDQLVELGGEAAVQAAIGAGANAASKVGERISFPKTFPQRMRVTFLPEEITTTKSSLSGAKPELGRKRVTAPLTWVDD
jgi:hypothetical protein